MPNPGHPSRGCYVCRAMKVKCDAMRPFCDRCIRAGRVCTGYRTEAQLFRYVHKPNKAKARPRPVSESDDSSPALSSPALDSARSLTRRRPLLSPAPSPTIAAPISIDWTDQSICLFIAEYVAPSDALQTTRGFFEYLPTMYSTSSSVHLIKAVEATSLAHLANTSSIDRLKGLARRAYGQALLDLAAAMNSKVRATSDETLATLSILAIYEVITGECPIDEPFHAHFRGQSTLLKMRGGAQFSTPVGRSLFATTNRVLWWRDLAVADRDEPTYGLADWPDEVYSSWLGDTSARLSVRVAKVGRRVRDLAAVAIDERDETWEESLRLVGRDTLNTDLDIQQSYDNAPEEWRWRSLPPMEPSGPCASTSASGSAYQPSDPESSDSSSSSHFFRVALPSTDLQLDDIYQNQAPSYPLRIDTYASPFVASLWNSIRCVRLHLLVTMRKLLVLNQQHPISPRLPLPTPAAMRAIAYSTVNDICASVPLLLGDIDTNGNLCSVKTAGNRGKLCNRVTLMWSLHKMCRVPGLDPGLKKWIVKILERIGTVGEMRQALNLSKMHAESY